MTDNNKMKISQMSRQHRVDVWSVRLSGAAQCCQLLPTLYAKQRLVGSLNLNRIFLNWNNEIIWRKNGKIKNSNKVGYVRAQSPPPLIAESAYFFRCCIFNAFLIGWSRLQFENSTIHCNRKEIWASSLLQVSFCERKIIIILYVARIT